MVMFYIFLQESNISFQIQIQFMIKLIMTNVLAFYCLYINVSISKYTAVSV